MGQSVTNEISVCCSTSKSVFVYVLYVYVLLVQKFFFKTPVMHMHFLSETQTRYNASSMSNRSHPRFRSDSIGLQEAAIRIEYCVYALQLLFHRPPRHRKQRLSTAATDRATWQMTIDTNHILIFIEWQKKHMFWWYGYNLHLCIVMLKIMFCDIWS